MLGGISGHAGLFATSNDLMKLMELYRRKGEYGGEQIIQALSTPDTPGRLSG
jgi:beta-N-acetylhexosaminidase